MTKRLNEQWPRLAGACMAARDDLRALLPRLDAVLVHGMTDPRLIEFVRQLAARHAESLKAALKAPAAPRTHRNTDSARFQPLWGVLEGNGGGTYRKPTRRGAPHQ